MPLVADDVLFIHIPKNAGTSIESAFSRQVSPRGSELTELGDESPSLQKHLGSRITEKLVNKSRALSRHLGSHWRVEDASDLFGARDVELVTQHLTLREVLGMGIIDPSTAERLSIFYVVRDPYARLLSIWRESRSRGFTNVSLDYFLGQFLSESLADQPGWSRHDWTSRRRLQIEFFDLTGSVFESERLNLTELRFERLNEDFGSLCRTLGVGELKLPHRNRSDGDGHDFASLVSLERLREVNTRYAQDFSALGYPVLEA